MMFPKLRRLLRHDRRTPEQDRISRHRQPGERHDRRDETAEARAQRAENISADHLHLTGPRQNRRPMSRHPHRVRREDGGENEQPDQRPQPQQRLPEIRQRERRRQQRDKEDRVVVFAQATQRGADAEPQMIHHRRIFAQTHEPPQRRGGDERGQHGMSLVALRLPDELRQEEHPRRRRDCGADFARHFPHTGEDEAAHTGEQQVLQQRERENINSEHREAARLQPSVERRLHLVAEMPFLRHDELLRLIQLHAAAEQQAHADLQHEVAEHSQEK